MTHKHFQDSSNKDAKMKALTRLHRYMYMHMLFSTFVNRINNLERENLQYKKTTDSVLLKSDLLTT